MIKRPVNLKIMDLLFVFNFQFFNKLEIDLDDINKISSSSYQINQIAVISLKLLSGVFLYPSEIKFHNEEACSYFVHKGYYENQKYKIVLCICSDRPKSLGIITLHRL